MKRPVAFSAVAAVVLAGFVAAGTRRGSDSNAEAAAAPRPVLVTLTTASLEDLAQPFDIGGNVRARESATITSRIVAEVQSVRVGPGDRVRAGEPLVILDARDLHAAHSRAQASVTAAEQALDAAAAERQAAEAALALASTTFDRMRQLREKNSATANEMDQATAALRGAEARKKSAEAQVAQASASIEVARAAAEGAAVGESYATLAAPFDGVVTQKLVDPGNMASPGVPLLTLEDARAFRLEVRIDEARAALVKIGGHAEVVLDGVEARPDGGQAARIVGRVSEVARVLDPNAHAFLAKIDLPAIPGLRGGMFGRARFAGPNHRALAVPATAILRRGQLTSVFVVDATGVARLRLVTVSEASSGRVEVRAGLDAGERVVDSPPVTLPDGTPVAPAPASHTLGSVAPGLVAEGRA